MIKANLSNKNVIMMAPEGGPVDFFCSPSYFYDAEKNFYYAIDYVNELHEIITKMKNHSDALPKNKYNLFLNTCAMLEEVQESLATIQKSLKDNKERICSLDPSFETALSTLFKNDTNELPDILLNNYNSPIIEVDETAKEQTLFLISNIKEQQNAIVETMHYIFNEMNQTTTIKQLIEDISMEAVNIFPKCLYVAIENGEGCDFSDLAIILNKLELEDKIITYEEYKINVESGKYLNYVLATMNGSTLTNYITEIVHNVVVKMGPANAKGIYDDFLIFNGKYFGNLYDGTENYEAMVDIAVGCFKEENLSSIFFGDEDLKYLSRLYALYATELGYTIDDKEDFLYYNREKIEFPLTGNDNKIDTAKTIQFLQNLEYEYHKRIFSKYGYDFDALQQDLSTYILTHINDNSISNQEYRENMVEIVFKAFNTDLSAFDNFKNNNDAAVSGNYKDLVDDHENPVYRINVIDDNKLFGTISDSFLNTCIADLSSEHQLLKNNYKNLNTVWLQLENQRIYNELSLYWVGKDISYYENKIISSEDFLVRRESILEPDPKYNAKYDEESDRYVYMTSGKINEDWSMTEKEYNLYLSVMTPKEKSEFHYLYHMYGESVAKQYFDIYQEDWNSRIGMIRAAEFYNRHLEDAETLSDFSKEAILEYHRLGVNGKDFTYVQVESPADDPESIYVKLTIAGEGEKTVKLEHLSLDDLGFLGVWPISQEFLDVVNTACLGLLDGSVSFLTGIGNLVGGADGVVSIRDFYTMYLNMMLAGTTLETVYNVSSSIGNMAIPMATAAVVNSIAPGAGQFVSSIMMGLSSAGNSYESALQSGANYWSAVCYAALSGLSETTLGYYMGKIPGISQFGGFIDDLKDIGTASTKTLVGTIFKKTGINLFAFGYEILSEGAEESTQSILESVFSAFCFGGGKIEINWEEVKMSGIYGMITAGLLNGGVMIYNGSGIVISRIENLTENAPIIARAEAAGIEVDYTKIHEQSYIDSLKTQTDAIANENSSTPNTSFSDTLTYYYKYLTTPPPTNNSSNNTVDTNNGESSTNETINNTTNNGLFAEKNYSVSAVVDLFNTIVDNVNKENNQYFNSPEYKEIISKIERCYQDIEKYGDFGGFNKSAIDSLNNQIQEKLKESLMCELSNLSQNQIEMILSVTPELLISDETVLANSAFVTVLSYCMENVGDKSFCEHLLTNEAFMMKISNNLPLLTALLKNMYAESEHAATDVMNWILQSDFSITMKTEILSDDFFGTYWGNSYASESLGTLCHTCADVEALYQLCVKKNVDILSVIKNSQLSASEIILLTQNENITQTFNCSLNQFYEILIGRYNTYDDIEIVYKWCKSNNISDTVILKDLCNSTFGVLWILNNQNIVSKMDIQEFFTQLNFSFEEFNTLLLDQTFCSVLETVDIVTLITNLGVSSNLKNAILLNEKFFYKMYYAFSEKFGKDIVKSKYDIFEYVKKLYEYNNFNTDYIIQHIVYNGFSLLSRDEVLDLGFEFVEKVIHYFDVYNALMGLNKTQTEVFNKMLSSIDSSMYSDAMYIDYFVTRLLDALRGREYSNLFNSGLDSNKNAGLFNNILTNLDLNSLSQEDWNILTVIALRDVSIYDSNPQLNIFPPVNNVDGLSNYEQRRQQMCNEYFERAINNSDLDGAKNALLNKYFNLNIEDAQEIIRLYGTSIDQFKNNPKYEMEVSYIEVIASILNIDKLSTIKDVYLEPTAHYENIQIFDFDKIVYVDQAIKQMFTENIRDSLYNVTDPIIDSNGQQHESTPQNMTFRLTLDGVETVVEVPVYTPGNDFKILLSVLGAYGKAGDFSNYYDLWNNNSRVNNHGICTSLISNSFMGTSEVKNVVLGFTDFDLTALNNMAPYDLISINNKYDRGTKKPNLFMSAEDMIAYSRIYSELNLERKNVQPSYVVIFSDMSSELIAESIKCSEDMGIPIVYIDRTQLTQQEVEKIDKLIVDYFANNEVNVESRISALGEILSLHESNRCGMFYDNRNALRDTYFPTSKITGLFDSVLLQLQNEFNQTGNILNYLENSYHVLNILEEENNKYCITANAIDLTLLPDSPKFDMPISEYESRINSFINDVICNSSGRTDIGAYIQQLRNNNPDINLSELIKMLCDKMK